MLFALPLVKAGIMFDSDAAQLEPASELSLDCGSCTFIETLDTVPLPDDPRQAPIIITLLSGLLLIGFVGIKYRVRARQLKRRAAH